MDRPSQGGRTSTFVDSEDGAFDASRWLLEKKGFRAELELRYNINGRWAMIGFAAAGRAWGQQTSFDDAAIIVNKEFGFPYLIARTLGLYTGVDFAWGPEDFAFYIQVGSAWR